MVLAGGQLGDCFVDKQPRASSPWARRSRLVRCQRALIRCDHLTQHASARICAHREHCLRSVLRLLPAACLSTSSAGNVVPTTIPQRHLACRITRVRPRPTGRADRRLKLGTATHTRGALHSARRAQHGAAAYAPPLVYAKVETGTSRYSCLRLCFSLSP